MSISDTVNTECGAVGFYGSVRGADELGHELFRIDLPGYPRLYGEYRQKFAENPNDFDIEIISFGYRDPRNAGLSGSRITTSVSFEERQAVESLVRTLFGSQKAAQAREGMSTFAIKSAAFLGGIHFQPGWISVRAGSARGVRP